MNLRFAAFVAFLTLLVTSNASAIILFGRGNEANLSDPATGVPWWNVSRLTNSDGSQVGSSAVYLGNGYMLTADHVQERTHVTFDGENFWAVEAGSFQQVAPNVDLKVFRLSEDPGISGLLLYEDLPAGEDLSESATLIGWGVGRNPSVAVNSEEVDWGSTATMEKRWGVNETLESAGSVAYESGSYAALMTRLSSDAGNDEAAVTLHDSGSAMFQFIDGEWYLSGIAATVSRDGESVFGTGDLGDLNYFVRVSEYRDEIYAAIPEPASWGWVLSIGGLAGAAVAKRWLRRVN